MASKIIESRKIARKIVFQKDSYWTSVLASFVITNMYFLALFFYNANIEIGFYHYFKKLMNKEKTTLDDIFVGLTDKNVAQVIGASCRRFIYTLLWALLFIIPGIAADLKYSLTGLLMAQNKQLSGKEAVKISKKLMKGKNFKLFLFDLSFLPARILSFLTFGIFGYLYFHPFYLCARMVYIHKNIHPVD